MLNFETKRKAKIRNQYTFKYHSDTWPGKAKRSALSLRWFFCFVCLIDSLRPINNLSVIKGRVFLGWTSTKLGLMFLLKDTTQWRRWGLNQRPFGLESSALPLSHCAPLSEWSQGCKGGAICLGGGGGVKLRLLVCLFFLLELMPKFMPQSTIFSGFLG